LELLKYYNQRILQAHCQIHTSQRIVQSFVKELAKPTEEKIVFKNFHRLKNYNTQHSSHPQKENETHGRQGLQQLDRQNASC